MIEVNNLVKRYGDHTAVDHLSFKIEKGKIYGFLGPNGAVPSSAFSPSAVRMNGDAGCLRWWNESSPSSVCHSSRSEEHTV